MRLSELRDAVALLDKHFESLERGALKAGGPDALEALSEDPEYIDLWERRERLRIRADEMEAWVLTHCRPPEVLIARKKQGGEVILPALGRR